ncbi:hypothetical protein DI392_10260 [Vibrio albus]|uniref:DUF1090 domain-containing protein n=1 Tax=Vibrio albus TaxID=2200953 RepID=A0A2U3B8Y9_9VIBR|nr:hypothetical protein [Vibrio albus]PWI33237.1 hypothetical protein DI392_10260 [Vibrio albus]
MKKLLLLTTLIASCSVMAEKPSWAGKGKPDSDNLRENSGLMVGLDCEAGDDACKERLKQRQEFEKEQQKRSAEQRKERIKQKEEHLKELDKRREEQQKKMLELEEERLKLQEELERERAL